MQLFDLHCDTLYECYETGKAHLREKIRFVSTGQKRLDIRCTRRCLPCFAAAKRPTHGVNR